MPLPCFSQGRRGKQQLWAVSRAKGHAAPQANLQAPSPQARLFCYWPEPHHCPCQVPVSGNAVLLCMCWEKKEGPWKKLLSNSISSNGKVATWGIPETYHHLELLPGHGGFVLPKASVCLQGTIVPVISRTESCTVVSLGNFPVSHLFIKILYAKGKTKKWKYIIFPRQQNILLILLSSLQNVLMIPMLNLMCYSIRQILTLTT